MFKWSCEIERADNGFILKNTSSGDDSIDLDLEVFQDEEQCAIENYEFESKVKSISEVFWRIAEFFAVHNNKYSNKRLVIKVMDDLEEKYELLKDDYKSLEEKYQKLLKGV